MQLALVLMQQVRPEMVQGISQDIMQTMSGMGSVATGGASAQMFRSDHIAGAGNNEPAQVEKARAKSGQASQPNSGKVVEGEKHD